MRDTHTSDGRVLSWFGAEASGPFLGTRDDSWSLSFGTWRDDFCHACYETFCLCQLLEFGCRYCIWYSCSRVAHVVKESPYQCRRCRGHGFVPWVVKMPWSRKWLSTSVFMPGKFHGQRSLVGYSPWSCKESDMTEHRHTVLTQWGQKAGPLPTSLLRSLWTLVNWMKCCIHVLYQVPRDRRFPSFRSCYSPESLRVAVRPLYFVRGEMETQGLSVICLAPHI